MRGILLDAEEQKPSSPKENLHPFQPEPFCVVPGGREPRRSPAQPPVTPVTPVTSAPSTSHFQLLRSLLFTSPVLTLYQIATFTPQSSFYGVSISKELRPARHCHSAQAWHGTGTGGEQPGVQRRYLGMVGSSCRGGSSVLGPGSHPTDIPECPSREHQQLAPSCARRAAGPRVCGRWGEDAESTQQQRGAFGGKEPLRSCRAWDRDISPSDFREEMLKP